MMSPDNGLAGRCVADREPRRHCLLFSQSLVSAVFTACYEAMKCFPPKDSFHQTVCREEEELA